MSRIVTFCYVLFLALSSSHAQPIEADIVLKGGTVIDGSGAERRLADVAISDDKIVAVGPDLNATAPWVIDCTGLIVCPGFIDLHNHSDTPITKPETRAAVNYLTQGCTTLVTGNCGSGPVVTGSYYKKIDDHGAGPNIAHLIPQGSLRRRVLGSDNIQPDDSQLQEMLDLAEKAMQDGAWGMSTGLIYVPSSYASTEEITAIAKVVAKHGGIYASHIRGEGTGVLKSVDEALQIGRDAALPVHISHFKSSGRDAWGLVREAARMIAKEREAGRNVTADQYPYVASSTSLGATLLPSSARAGGNKQLIKRLDDTETGPRLKETIRKAITKRDDGAAVRIARYKPNPSWVGKSLADIAKAEDRPAVDIALEIFRGGDASIVNFSMNEDDVRHIMAIDWVATASDGRAYLPGADRPHPRNYGTFPRKLGHYALQEEVLSLEVAVRSMTGLPAEILRMRDRGLIKEDLMADITVFDPKRLKDEATFDDPHRYSSGIRYVFVNGVPAISAGSFTGALAGKALRFEEPTPSTADTE
ncbi:N-acyl-D-amino-acid deacylase family protein [Fuerstiella marisgermanici]|nr:D-aminoacylase [Fuerstiella marisgermanici]